MDGLILIKYGELTTKKDNRRLFINTLYDNINKKLKTLEHNIIKEYSRMYIEYKPNSLSLKLSVNFYKFLIL